MSMRQTMSSAVVFIVFLVLSSGCSTEQGSGWKTLQEDAYHNKFSYDPGSVEHTPSNTIKVMASSSGAQYLYELDCKAKKMRILTDHGAEPSQWGDIAEGSGDRLLYEALCLN